MSSHHHHNHIHSTNHQEVRMPTTRKRRRGMIEKRRRDKINNSLSELRRLVPTANEKQNSSKLEKAEILQLTVDYLRSLHARGIITDTISNGRLPLQNSDSNQTDSTTILSSSNTSTLLASPDPLQSQQPSSTMDPTNQQQLNQGNILMRSPQPQSQHQQLQHGAQQIHQTTSSTSPSQASSLSENIHDNQTLTSLQQYSAAAAAAAVLSSDQHQGGLNVVSAPVNHHPIEYLAYNQQHHHHHHAQMSAAAAYHQHSQQQQHQQHHGNHPQQHLPQQQHHQHPHQVAALNNRHSSMKMESHNPFQSPLVLPHTHSSLLNLDHHHHHQSHHHNPLAYSSHHHHHPSYHNATFSAAPSSATN